MYIFTKTRFIFKKKLISKKTPESLNKFVGGKISLVYFFLICVDVTSPNRRSMFDNQNLFNTEKLSSNNETNPLHNRATSSTLTSELFDKVNDEYQSSSPKSFEEKSLSNVASMQKVELKFDVINECLIDLEFKTYVSK